MKIIQNTGKAAIVEMNGTKTTISKVYLKKLIRQDSTGIWTASMLAGCEANNIQDSTDVFKQQWFYGVDQKV